MSDRSQGANGGVEVDVSGGDQTFGRRTRAFYIGGAGALAVTMDEGNDLTFTGLTAGTILPVQATAVLNSGTTATDVIALF